MGCCASKKKRDFSPIRNVFQLLVAKEMQMQYIGKIVPLQTMKPFKGKMVENHIFLIPALNVGQ